VAFFWGSLIFGLICVILVVNSSWYKRRLTHDERMKALEMGHPLPDHPEVARIKARAAAKNSYVDGQPIPENIRLARACYKIATTVAFLGFAAVIPCSFFGGAGVCVSLVLATAAISVTSVLCGTYLVTHNIAAPSYASKPLGDPDAFDVAGRRG
jgi:hypothetical protein